MVQQLNGEQLKDKIYTYLTRVIAKPRKKIGGFENTLYPIKKDIVGIVFSLYVLFKIVDIRVLLNIRSSEIG